jgi:hypothetical protein
MTLIELSEQEQELLEMVTETDEDLSLTEEQKEIVKQSLVDDYLIMLEDLHSKMDSYASMIKGLKVRANFRSDEASTLSSLAKKDLNLTKLLEQRLVAVLQGRGEKRVETMLHKITVAQNGGKRPLIVPRQWESEPASAPEQFHRHKIELDKEAVRTALLEGTEIEGCKIDEPGFHLRIS